MIAPELEVELSSSKNLPTLPGVASRIIELSNDPEVHLESVADVIAKDPALATKILRIANSSMYARQRRTENVTQALLLLGLDATISLALSFSLLQSSQRGVAESGLDYTLFWRRSLLTATASQALSKVIELRDSEALFLTSLIQNIGVLALDRARPDLYYGIESKQVSEEALIDHERLRLGVDHADVGGWLLSRWHFPERIQHAVEYSHTPANVSPDDENARFFYAVMLACRIAQVFLEDSGERQYLELAKTAQHYLGIDNSQLNELFTEIGTLIPEAESVFETELLNHGSTEAILEEAREALLVRNLKALSTVNSLKEETASLEKRTEKLEESSRRDALTGLFNRAFLDHFLSDTWKSAGSGTSPLSVAFADLDRFKSVNDSHGHAIGDQILIKTAKALLANTRDTDIVARYGGEEFVIVLPNTDEMVVDKIAQRIVAALEQTPFDMGGGRELRVTISLGVATHGGQHQFDSPGNLIKAADRALYAAKLSGRNRSIAFSAELSQHGGTVILPENPGQTH